MPHKHTANQKITHWGVLGGCTRKPKKTALTGGIPGVNAYAHHKGILDVNDTAHYIPGSEGVGQPRRGRRKGDEGWLRVSDRGTDGQQLASNLAHNRDGELTPN